MSLKAIFGLGNPGDAYLNTRHNIGFNFINALKNNSDTEPSKKVHLKSHVISAHFNGEKLLLVKPQTFMNLSGESVIAVMNYYKLTLDEICVVTDDIDIDFGTLRLRKKGGAGTHNGMKSIIAILGSQDFLRLRIGIGPKPSIQDLSSFVLQKFSSNELEDLSGMLSRISTVFTENLNQPKDILLTKLNSKV